MTLVILKQGKRDTREIDFDRDMKRVTLQRTVAEKDLGILKDVIFECEKRRDRILRDIIEGQKNLSGIRREIVTIVREGGENVAVLRSRERKAGVGVKDKQSELQKLDDYFASLVKQIELRGIEISALDDKLNALRVQIADGKSELIDVNDEIVRGGIAIAEATKRLKEIDEEIAASEEFVVALNERDKFLSRKEADLNVYEQRLAQRRSDAGIKNLMVFK